MAGRKKKAVPRRCNEAGRNLIKEFEGLRLHAYRCPAGIWTIGYGHTRGVKEGDTCTRWQADQYLIEDLVVAEAAVSRLISVPLTDNQFAALVSFTFNLGSEALRESTLRRQLNLGRYDLVPGEMARWVKYVDPVTHVVGKLPGLVRRRAAEGKLWVTV